MKFFLKSRCQNLYEPGICLLQFSLYHHHSEMSVEGVVNFRLRVNFWSCTRRNFCSVSTTLITIVPEIQTGAPTIPPFPSFLLYELLLSTTGSPTPFVCIHGEKFDWDSARIPESSTRKYIYLHCRWPDAEGNPHRWYYKAERLYCLIPCQPGSGEDALWPKTSHEAMATNAHKQDRPCIRHARRNGRLHGPRRY